MSGLYFMRQGLDMTIHPMGSGDDGCQGAAKRSRLSNLLGNRLRERR